MQETIQMINCTEGDRIAIGDLSTEYLTLKKKCFKAEHTVVSDSPHLSMHLIFEEFDDFGDALTL